MKSKNLCKADIEYKLQNYLTNELGVDGEYYVKLSKKKDTSKLVGLPENFQYQLDYEPSNEASFFDGDEYKEYSAIDSA